jgi:hypothetical protein
MTELERLWWEDILRQKEEEPIHESFVDRLLRGGFAIPQVRQPFPRLTVDDLVGVQPMTAPTGLAYTLRFNNG